MRLYMLDDETENPLSATVPVDYDYQAEQWVQDVAQGRERSTRRPLIVFMLCDSQGIRCIWTRSVEDAAANQLPRITKVAQRFGGEWERSVESLPMIAPTDPYEHVVHARHLSS